MQLRCRRSESELEANLVPFERIFAFTSLQPSFILFNLNRAYLSFRLSTGDGIERGNQ